MCSRHKMHVFSFDSSFNFSFFCELYWIQCRRLLDDFWIGVLFAFVLAQSNAICLRQVGKLAFPVCHLLVLCSACVNPLLYGWLNDNFRREFVKVLCSCCGHCCQCVRCCAVSSSTITMTTLATAPAPTKAKTKDGALAVDTGATGGQLLTTSSLAPPIYRNHNGAEREIDVGSRYQNETGSNINPTETNGDQGSNVG